MKLTTTTQVSVDRVMQGPDAILHRYVKEAEPPT